ncbi:MAG: cyclic nucleotide-gated ion channel [Pseudomonadota bacterium]
MLTYQDTMRRRLYMALEATHTNEPLQHWLRWIITGLIVVSVTALILETEPSLQARFGSIFVAIEMIAVACFTLEYLVRVWVSVEERAPGFKHPVWGRLRYMLTPMALIDLIAFLPSLITLFGIGGQSFLSVRLIRLLRLLKITRYSPALRTMANAVYAERKAALAVLLIMGMSLVFLSSLVWFLEREAQPDAFRSIPAAMWWGIATLTTIGYGDVVPITPWGKMVGAIGAMTGVAMFAMPAAILASGFIRELNRQDFRVTHGVVAHVPLFENLNSHIIADVSNRLQPKTIPARYAIVRPREEPNALYFIEAGQIEIVEPHKQARIFGPGQVFGAVELLPGSELPQFTATALSECRLLALEAEDFTEMFEQYPEIRGAVLRATDTEDGSLVFVRADDAIARIETANEAVTSQDAKAPGHPSL